jgi:hypothetical protein
MTAPLKKMYSGDFYFGGAPVAYMRLFDAVHPDPNNNQYFEATWTTNFASLQVPLLPGDDLPSKLALKNGTIQMDSIWFIRIKP